MRTYTIIGGVNGVGKSSFTGALKSSQNDLGVIVDVDKLTAELGGDPLTGGRVAVRRIRDCLERGLSYTQESTLSGHNAERTCRLAKERGYTIRLYYIALDSSNESRLRIENRVRHGGHDIPYRVVERRFVKRWEDLVRILPYCDRVELYDNDNGFSLVAEVRNGELLSIGEKHPRWLSELNAFMKQR